MSTSSPPSTSASSDSKDSGSHSFPITRVKAIIESVPDTIPASSEGLFAFSKAAELFVEDLVRRVGKVHGNQFDYDELADFVCSSEELYFLHDFFPKRITFEEAVKKRQASGVKEESL